MLVGGLVAGQGEIEVLRLIAIAWAAAVAGDVTSFVLGRRLGRAFLVRHGPKVSITEERLREGRGASSSATAARRSCSGASSGSCARWRRSSPARRGCRCGASCPTTSSARGCGRRRFILLGYVFWASFDRVVHYAEQGALALGTVICRRRRAHLARALDARGATTAAAPPRSWRSRPSGPRCGRSPRSCCRSLGWSAARSCWSWQRLTPGELGLEVTTLLAVLGVSIVRVLRQRVGRPPRRRRALRRRRPAAGRPALRRLGGRRRRRCSTHLGSLPVVGVAGAGSRRSSCAWRREVAPGARCSWSGRSACSSSCTSLKAAFDRPRPARPHVDADLSAFPSGHAAYAVTWVAVARRC